MIKAIFFDWMGTLGNSDDMMVTKDNFLEFMNGELDESLLTKKFERIHLPKKEKERLSFQLKNSKHRLYSDSEKIIKDLKSKGYRLVLISNMYDISANRIQNLFPSFLKNFDLLLFSSEVGIMKPNKEIFKLALDKLNLRPAEVIMIGNKEPEDIFPAVGMGMNARLINRNKEKLKDVLGDLI